MRITRVISPFLAAGAMIVLVHQPIVWLLHEAAVVPWRGFDLTRIPPLGIPALVNAVFWGAVWGPLIAWFGRDATPYGHLRAAAAGGVLTTVVGAALTWSGRGTAIPAASAGQAVAASLAINGVWAAATSVLSARLLSSTGARTSGSG